MVLKDQWFNENNRSILQYFQGESDERMKLSEEGQVDTSVTEMGRY